MLKKRDIVYKAREFESAISRRIADLCSKMEGKDG